MYATPRPQRSRILRDGRARPGQIGLVRARHAQPDFAASHLGELQRWCSGSAEPPQPRQADGRNPDVPLGSGLWGDAKG